MMDVTFVLEESGMTVTVEVPCEANVAAAKEIACTALAVSPASVEMRIGTQVLEGTCRLQDTAFGAGVQVVLARRFADIKCPAEYSTRMGVQYLSLSRCGTLCIYRDLLDRVCGFDTETFSTAFEFTLGSYGPPAISRCKTRCYLACEDWLLEVALPGGEVLRKVDGSCTSVYACGGVVVSQGEDGVSVYDEDLTLLRFLSHKYQRPRFIAVSDCGGWVITSSDVDRIASLWDVNTGEAVARVRADRRRVALSRSASVFAVDCSKKVQLYDWSGAALGSFDKEQCQVYCIHFTPCGKYLVAGFERGESFCEQKTLHQYDVATMSCVRVIQDSFSESFAISPCSRVVMFGSSKSDELVTRHLYPY